MKKAILSVAMLTCNLYKLNLQCFEYITIGTRKCTKYARNKLEIKYLSEKLSTQCTYKIHIYTFAGLMIYI